MDFASARHFMVESQVRPNDVTHLGVVAAMRSLAREAFVPARLAPLAYADMELPMAPGRVLLRPRDLSKLLQALEPQPGQKALEIAGATGYGAAVLAQCGCDAITLDPDPELCLAARAALEASGLGEVRAVSTEIGAGWSEGGPYDLILVNGAVEVLPSAWTTQLAEGGRLAVIVRKGAAGEARLYIKQRGEVSYRVAFDAAPPVLPGTETPPAFVF
jgi:protein-L-isoaspartate(D-aspartate) O-methyltransferase